MLGVNIVCWLDGFIERGASIQQLCFDLASLKNILKRLKKEKKVMFCFKKKKRKKKRN